MLPSMVEGATGNDAVAPSIVKGATGNDAVAQMWKNLAHHLC